MSSSRTYLPKFKVVDPEPSYGFVMRNVRISEFIGLSSFVGAVYAYFNVQGRYRAPRYAAVMAGQAFLMGTFVIGGLSINRITGHSENSDLVKKYGYCKTEDVIEYYNKINTPMHDLIGMGVDKFARK